MYPLGRQFSIDTSKGITSKEKVVIGKTFRISVITERIVRLEYSKDGIFNDLPTQLVRKRDINNVKCSIEQDNNKVKITTKYFNLLYHKEKPFIGTKIEPGKNLKITLISKEKERCKDWYYQHPEARNMYGNIVSTDVGVPKILQRGLYSLDGFSSIDDSLSKIINEDGTLSEPPKNHYDIYVCMYDKDFKQLLFDYFKLTGPPALIPRYALGNWWSRNITYNDSSYKKLIKNFEKKKIPISVMLFDHDWHIREKDDYSNIKGGFTFNPKLFNDPKIMIDNFHQRGIKVGLVVNPTEGIYSHDLYYTKACELLNVKTNTLIKIDPLNPKLLDVLFKVCLHPLEALGVDFFWCDVDTKTDITRLWSYAHYMFLDSGRSNKKRGLVLARSGLIAPHRYPVLYGGSSLISWKNLKELPFLYLNASNIGVSWWSHDVAGNHGGVEESGLYLRYIELSTFSPILRFHGARGIYYKKEPWLWDIKTASIAADYLRLRHRLIPYLYTEAYNYTRTGIPLIQPFYYNYMWVYDDEIYKNQYYFGSQLLVCPILDKSDNTMNRTIHRFFIPDGIWYDFFTGKKFPGNKKYISFFKDEDYPVFAHSGSIIPLSNRSDYNNVGIPTDMEIQIFPGVSNTYTLYEDDGITSLYREGYFLKTSIDYNYLKNNYTVIIRSIEGKSGIVPEKRNYKMVFRNVREADSVTTYFNSEMFSNTYYVDGNDFIVEVKDVPTIGQLTINCKGKDIEIDAQRIINDDVNSILMDLRIDTYLKENIAEVMFSTLSNSKKRIEIRKLKKKGLTKEYINLFLKLLEYINEV